MASLVLLIVLSIFRLIASFALSIVSLQQQQQKSEIIVKCLEETEQNSPISYRWSCRPNRVDPYWNWRIPWFVFRFFQRLWKLIKQINKLLIFGVNWLLIRNYNHYYFVDRRWPKPSRRGQQAHKAAWIEAWWWWW